MERLAPRACLALLWGCLLAATAAAQGKEGECARRRPPGPTQPRRPDPRTPAPPGARRSWTRATLETDLAPPSPGVLRSGGLAGCDRDESGTPPPPGVIGAPGTKRLGPGRAGFRGRREGDPELYSVLCGDLNGRKCKKEGIYEPITDSLCCTAETNTTL